MRLGGFALGASFAALLCRSTAAAEEEVVVRGVDCSGRTCRDLTGPPIVVPSLGVEAQL